MSVDKKAKLYRRVTKVKHQGNQWLIVFEIVRQDGQDNDQHSVKCGDAPHPDFIEAMEALPPCLAKEAEIPNGVKWCADVEVTGVSVSWSQDTMGAVLTGKKPLKYANAPLIINTPHKPESPYSDGDEMAKDMCLAGTTAKAIWLVMEEALAYVDGKRAQQRLTGLDDAA
jgi:hypothetical protein